MPSETPTPSRLSPRQREVLELASRGLTNREIARALGISPATVHAHLSAVYAALEVTNRTEASAAFLTWQSRAEQGPAGGLIALPAAAPLDRSWPHLPGAAPGDTAPGQDAQEPTLVFAHYGPLHLVTPCS